MMTEKLNEILKSQGHAVALNRGVFQKTLPETALVCGAIKSALPLVLVKASALGQKFPPHPSNHLIFPPPHLNSIHRMHIPSPIHQIRFPSFLHQMNIQYPHIHFSHKTLKFQILVDAQRQLPTTCRKTFPNLRKSSHSVPKFSRRYADEL